MAITQTTASAAVLANDVTVAVTSATGFAAGNWVRVEGEMMLQTGAAVGTNIPVKRGIDGTATLAHAKTANVTTGLMSDLALPPLGVECNVTNPVQPAFPIYSYGAAGAITLAQGIHIINGTSVLAMTLANPTKDMDGQLMFIASNGKAAHTVTYTAGLGNVGATADVGTYPSGALSCCLLIALSGFWVSVTTGGSASIFPVFA